MDTEKVVMKGYALAKESATPTMAALLAGGVSSVGTKALDAATNLVRLGANVTAKVAPYALAAPPLAGLAAGYAASQLTAPTGEDMNEAQKHLEEQALLEFQSDLHRQREARKLLRDRLMPGGKKEREIRI